MALWAAGGVVNMMGSLSYAELGASIKQSGGEVAYLKEAYPRSKDFLSYLFNFLIIV